MRSWKTWGILVGTLTLIGRLSAQAPVAEKPAAVVNGEAIAVAEVKALLDQRPSPVALTEAQKRELRQTAVDMLVDDLLMRQFLRKNAQTPNPAEVAKEMAELLEALRKQTPPKTLDQFLREGGQTEAQLRTDIAARLQWKTYLTSRLPDAAVKSYYDANKVFFDKVFVRASHILVKLAANATPAEKQAAQAKLSAIRQEIMAGKLDFTVAAKTYSDCPSKEKGGDIGPFPYKFVVVEPFAKAAFSLRVGDVSDVVATEFGYHLIKATDRTAGEPSNFDTLRETVREVYAQELELYQNILSEQRKTSRIEVFLQ